MILDASARKFWNTYMGNDKTTEFDFLWECLQQEWGDRMNPYDLIQVERALIKELDKNGNHSVSTIEFNQWTRKSGFEKTFTNLLKETKNTAAWHDDEDGQWAMTDEANKLAQVVSLII